jgi:hypothetical protein
MKNTTVQDEKREYLSPELEIFLLEMGRDIVCMSNNENDNEFSAGNFGD